MIIGIDCRVIYDVGKNKGAGVERYVFYLVKNLLKYDKKNQYVLFFSGKTSQMTIDSLKRSGNFKMKIVTENFSFISRHLFFTFTLWRYGLDRMIFPANVMPLFYVGKSILIIHDLAIYYHPEWFPNKQWFAKLILVPGSVAKATDIVTVSQSTKEELLDLFKFKKSKNIHVIYPGVFTKKISSEKAKDDILEKYQIKGRFLFFVGTIEPRKNLINLFKGYEKFVLDYSERIPLLIAGVKGWKFKKIFRHLGKTNKNLGWEGIIYLGKISDKERSALLERAEIFLFPSHYEGFGFPVLEAMSLSCPVIAGRSGALAEYISDQAILVSPKKSVEIAQAIKKILSDSEFKKNLIKNGLHLSDRFTWEKTSKKLLELIEAPN